MEETNINMVSRVGGVMGQLGRRGRKVSVEILSVGRQFREPGIRILEDKVKSQPFVRLFPM